MLAAPLEQDSSSPQTNPPANLDFPQTRWSLVVSASDEAESALEELCAMYWRPVYNYLRRAGYNQQDSEDVTQSYFARLLKQDSFIKADAVNGRLRFYLLGGLKRHLADFHRHKGAAKRGSNREHLPLAGSELDFENAEHHYAAHPVDELTPDRIFEQSWALDLLARAHKKIRAQYEANGKTREYELLKPAIATTSDIDAAKAAAELGIGRDSIRVFVSRLRKNFRAALKEEISETVTSRDEVDDELTHLMNVFS